MKRIIIALSLLITASLGLYGLSEEDQITIKEFIAKASPNPEQINAMIDGFSTQLDKDLELFSGKGRLIRLHNSLSTTEDQDQMRAFKLDISEASGAAKHRQVPDEQVASYAEAKNLVDKLKEYFQNTGKGYRAIVLQGVKGKIQSDSKQPGFRVTKAWLDDIMDMVDPDLQQLEKKTRAGAEELQKEVEGLKTKFHVKEAEDIDSFFKQLESEVLG